MTKSTPGVEKGARAGWTSGGCQHRGGGGVLFLQTTGRRGSLVLAGLALLASMGAPGYCQQAAIPSPSISRSVPGAPDPRHVFVMDSAHLLSDGAIRALQDSAQALQIGTGADIAFVTLPTLHGGSVEEAALTIGRSWKIGSSGSFGDPARARGLVVLYVPDRSSVAGPNLRVEVGRGLEGAITDGGGSRAILDALKPPLRAKRYDAAFLSAFNSAALLIRGDVVARPVSAAAAPPPPPPAHQFPIILIFFGLALVVLAAHLIFRRVLASAPSVRPRERRVESNTQPSTTHDDVIVTAPYVASADIPDTSGGSAPDAGGGSFGGGGDFSGGGASDSV